MAQMQSHLSTAIDAFPTECDWNHAKNVAAWESVQSHASTAMEAPYSGMIRDVDAAASFRAHKQRLEEEGYAFGTYNTDRSLFEKLDRLVFASASDMGRSVFNEAKSMLDQINRGSKPQRNTFSMLVMMDTKYVTPIANLVLLLTHSFATSDDLELFWQVTDRLWCFAHPVYRLHSGHLDATCAKITRRLIVASTESFAPPSLRDPTPFDAEHALWSAYDVAVSMPRAPEILAQRSADGKEMRIGIDRGDRKLSFVLSEPPAVQDLVRLLNRECPRHFEFTARCRGEHHSLQPLSRMPMSRLFRLLCKDSANLPVGMRVVCLAAAADGGTQEAGVERVAKRQAVGTEQEVGAPPRKQRRV